MKSLLRPAQCFRKCKPFAALLGIFVSQAAMAAQPLYQNFDVLQYTIPGTPPPQIDATAVDNENSFTVNYGTLNPGSPLFETRDTLFYTNLGAMVANSPTNASGAFNFLLGFGYQNLNCGYNFDLFNGSHLWADTFYNPGMIRCVSVVDGNNQVPASGFEGLGNLLGLGLGSSLLYELNSFGEVLVSATNIINPGTVDVSVNGLIKFNGRNVDLTGGQLNVEPQLSFPDLATLLGFGFANTAPNIISVGAVGVDNIGEWNAGLYLSPNAATSSIVSVPPFILQMTNSQCYLDIRTTDHTIFRYVFVQNNSASVPYNVYIDDPNAGSLGFLPGAAHVEWNTGYTDPASGSPVSSYLYLTDDYQLGTFTNLPVVNGVPFNFQLRTSPTRLLFNPKPLNYLPLPNLYQSNNYSCFFGNLSAATYSTNISSLNPHGTITNLPGRIYLTASNELNLAFASISGPNYLALNCTNQFDGSPGASIAAPYSDIALGVTNGSLVISNLLLANLPTSSGKLQAWSSDWLDTSTGVTNEYKVLLVFSDFQPTTVPWIKDLYLHCTNNVGTNNLGTNSLVISDHLNVYESFYCDAWSMTLNTNNLGEGATSLDGEFTWLNPLPFNANSGSGLQQMPNLLWLTNNGAIRVLETANFGNTKTPRFVVKPGLASTPATATLSEILTNNVVRNDGVKIGTNLYIFATTITNKLANRVKIAANLDGSLSNLIMAINHGTGSGTAYSTNTPANPKVKAGGLKNHAFTVTALVPGTGGDLIQTFVIPATVTTNLAWSSPTLTNGVDGTPSSTNYTSFNNHSLIADQGMTLWTTYFANDGTITNGTGSFTLQSSLGVLTNGYVWGGGDVVMVATNTPAGFGINGLFISNTVISAGRKLTLWSTNISDGVVNVPGGTVTNGNFWAVGANSGGGTVDSGFNIPVMPLVGAGDLLGTTVTNIAPGGKTVYNVWAGHDYGLSKRGFNSNLALGRLVLDSFGPDGKLAYVFNGAGVSNALYVDCLILEDNSTHGNATNAFNFPWLQINTNMVIYFAQALEGDTSVAQRIDQETKNGGNGGRLRWIYSYAGYYSSTNLVYTNLDGSTYTNIVNAALAQSSAIDSDSDGLPNSIDPTPFFLPSQTMLNVSVVNVPPLSAKIQWTTIPHATNCVYYSTNAMATNWLPFTNFSRWYFGGTSRTNKTGPNSFLSPQAYINNSSLPDNSQQTNVWIFDPMTNVPHYYKVAVWPWLNFGE